MGLFEVYGEKANAKRMATVASVYCINEFIRNPEHIIHELNSNKSETVSRPKPAFKRTWASIEKSPDQVTKELFYEAFQRDLKKEKKWICLIDYKSRF